MPSARTKRPYNSQLRRQQALVTRRAILDSAQRRFERDGYVATTMEVIAADAGVALKTVYSAFTTKGKLLRAVWDLLLKGDTDEAPVAQRAWYQSILEERDPERKLRLLAQNAVVVKTRIGALLRVIRSAAIVDADAADLWQLIQTDFYENQRVIVTTLHQQRALRDGLPLEQATDIVWTLNHPDTWLLLVGQRGWAPGAFESWFGDTLCQQLLRPAKPRRPNQRAQSRSARAPARGAQSR